MGLETIGTQIAGTMLGIGLNQQGQNQQMQNQQTLNTQQYGHQRELNEQMQGIQQQNWDYTNYENQVKHLEKAGLNVGMLYGQGGAGGSTMGGASGGSAQGGSAPQNNAPAIMGLGLQQAAMASTIDLQKAQADKIRSETPTSGNTGNILLENMRQEGIEQFTNNKIKAWMTSDPENKAGATEYNEKYDYSAGIDETSKMNRQFEAALFKTEAEKKYLDANALLTNEKAKGYWTELLNATKNSNSQAAQAAAVKLASEWSTGEFTNWKTWTQLGKDAIQSASQLIK